MQTFKKLSFAQKFLNVQVAKGIPSEIIPLDNGKFQVSPIQAQPEATSEETTEEAGETSVETTSEAAPATNPKLVTVEIMGAFESKGYVYTPVINGKARWFQTKGLTFEKVSKTEGDTTLTGLKLTLPMKALKSRGLEHLAS